MSTNGEMDIDEKGEHASSRETTPQLPETLIAGRQRRSTAGNRLAQLLQQEQPDDIDLLFEEGGEDDEDFEAKHESDIDLGSSSDEEDRPQPPDDELAGEKELQQQERASKKRKAGSTYPGQKELDKLVKRQQSLREKRVTIQEPEQDGTEEDQNLTDSEPRTRKKSERISWIPTAEDQPSRQSSRRQTVANKQMIHERMKESNERRLKVIAAMNEASQRKKTQKVKLTQEMRLERAKKVEEKNKRSLNKWQVAEEARLEAQRAKLAALHNRKIEGPFIRFYSGRAEWDGDGHLVKIGRRKLVEEITDPKDKESNEKSSNVTTNIVDQPEAAEDIVMNDAPPGEDTEETKALDANAVLISEPVMEGEAMTQDQSSELVSDQPSEQPPEQSLEKSSEQPVILPLELPSELPTDEPPAQSSEPPIESLEQTSEILEEKPVEELTQQPVEQSSDKQPVEQSSDKQPEEQLSDKQPEEQLSDKRPEEQLSDKQPEEKPIDKQPVQPLEPAGTVAVEKLSDIPPSDAGLSDDIHHQIAEQLQGDLDASLLPKKPSVTSQTYISLLGFENEKLGKDFKSKVLFPHNRGPLPKPDRPLCVTTSLPARFIDPSTGLPYASLFGYKQIQRVKNGGLQWNNQLQCFFDGQEAAAGVPEGFFD
ncbi:hypothetical protein H072_8012 [Dactylellina haptotyla CBS 200.50]|uniref:Vps72/YL1 C-terminal domain-containing protein n=1 Tax=Dactylellina haptotyla (strain CBS 200.50) TaxID=1284197 RepID=S8BGF0_DACHA|nr:hypothetical protein H072_8012 [Dactylellina haptotyla CBS 200.50]